MQESDAPRPAAVKLRRPRKAAVLGPTGELQRRLQDLGDALDALVRAIQLDDPLAEGLALRSHQLWLEQHDKPLEWRPTELRIDGRLVLAADTDAGRFILLGYSAGLRALAIRRRSAPSDVMSLARQLAALEAQDIDAATFGCWLWRGVSLGFDVAQAPTASELGQALIGADRSDAELWTERDKHAGQLWNSLCGQAARALDATTANQRFGAPLEHLKGLLLQGELTLGVDQAHALRNAADDPSAWATAETGLLLRHPRLRSMLPAHHLTLRLIDVIEGAPRVEARLLELCSALDDGTLDLPLVGAAVACKLLASGSNDGVWLELASRAPPRLRLGVLAQLVERGESEASAREALCALLSQWGAAVLFERVDLARISPKLGTALLGAALANGTEVDALLLVLERMPVETALLSLIASPRLLAPAQPLLERLIVEQPLSSGRLLCDLVKASPAGARGVGAALLACQGSGFAAGVLEATLLALVQAGVGALFVLPLWDLRSAASGVRIAALAALEADPALLAQALTARKAGILEPPEIREALEELRWRRPR